ncbi:hypothetical protein HDU76_006568 [Blyttiomyces sp. JEL0837]|nr:hypothetical protein HDU76_006568 [Blyttiomyces sp. JEL0837]
MTTPTDVVRLVIVAARFGHGRLMMRLFNDLQQLPEEEKSKLRPLDELYSYILQVTAMGGSLEAFQYCRLHVAGEDLSFDYNPAFQKACRHGNLNIIQFLLSLDHSRLDPTADKNMAMTMAAQGGHAEVVKLLLTLEGVDATDDNNSALCHACNQGRTDVVRVLLAVENMDVTKPWNNAIMLAAETDSRGVVMVLCQDGKSVVEEDLADLHEEAAIYAAQAGYVEINDRLAIMGKLVLSDLCWEWKVSWRMSTTTVLTWPFKLPLDTDDNTAIREAAAAGHADVVKLLLSTHGVDPNVGLLAASENWHVEVIKVLLGAEGITEQALEDALDVGNDEIVQLLLDEFEM